MKVLDLCCDSQHVFEGWFGSEADYQSQLERGLVQCPLCGSARIQKRLSAPRLNLARLRDTANVGDGSVQQPDQRGAADGAAGRSNAPVAPQKSLNHLTERADIPESAAWLSLAKRILANTEDVGQNFAQEARRIHYGEVSERGIRGSTSVREACALLEEGIAVLPLMVPEALKGTLQ